MVKKIINIVEISVVTLTVILAILLAGVRIFGFKPYAVLSPSMSPKYLPGDLVYVHKESPQTIEKGEVITFVADDKLTVVTHRVHEVNREDRTFTTKGDANETADGTPVIYENVIGVVKFSIPKLGYLSVFLSNPSGKFAAVGFICFVIILSVIPELLPGKKNKKENS